MSEKLKPCPFCGGKPKFWDGLGTQADLTCNDCAVASVNMQVSDCLTHDERFGNDGPGFAFIGEPHYRYEEKAIQRVNEEMTEIWNTRAPSEAQWQPIETAPKDGQKLIIFYRNCSGRSRMVFGRWLTDEQAEHCDHDNIGLEAGWYEDIENWDDYSLVAIHEGEPSHWMPSPSPPQSPSSMVEHPVDNRVVSGSSPLGTTNSTINQGN